MKDIGIIDEVLVDQNRQVSSKIGSVYKTAFT